MTEEQREPLLCFTSTTTTSTTNLRTSIRSFFGSAFTHSENDEPYEPTTFMNILNSNVQAMTLEYVYFPLQIAKSNVRGRNGILIDELEDPIVSFLLDFHSVEEKKNASNVVVSVINATAGKAAIVKDVSLSHIQETKILVKVDLNSVTERDITSRNEFYKIQKGSSGSLYKLHVDIHLVNGSIVQQSTRKFQLLQGGTAASVPSSGRKRNWSSRNDTVDNPYSEDSTFPNDDDCLVQSQQIVCDYIKTRLLTLDNESIRIGKAIATPNGDVAYHFLLENDEDQFEEGEVVGLLPSTETNDQGESQKRQVITKLTFDSSSKALIKGVITRSQYLEAMKPPSGVRSETIAMMGIVPVQVRGRIQANEPLYSSPTHPGLGVSATELDHTQLSEAAFVGYAFSSRQTGDPDSAGMVQAAVSILQNCGQKLLSEKVNRLKQHLEVKIETVDKFSRRTRKCMCISMLMCTSVFLLVGVLIYQLLTPGSALRYYQCQRGRNKPYREATFSMEPLSDPQLTAVVNGIEFDFDNLLRKAGSQEYPKLELPGVRYYLNIDRCAYGFVTTGDVPIGMKRVRGATVFGVDEKCFRPYYFDEKSFRWKVYNSSSWLDYKNICCTPMSQWKTCKELKESQLCSPTTSCDQYK